MNISEAWDNVRQVAGPIREKYVIQQPEWVHTDSPLKYVDVRALEHTFAKSAVLASWLDLKRGDVVFEIGPGACMLLYILQEVYGCIVAGCDVPERPLYAEMAIALGVYTVMNGTIKPDWGGYPVSGEYDAIIGTQVSWLNDHSDEDVDVLIADLRACLTDKGRIVLFTNPQAFGGRDAAGVLSPFDPERINLPFLGDGFVIQKERTKQ